MILRRIIVVDDEILQRNVLTKILKKITPETEITACANGKEAYEELQRKGAAPEFEYARDAIQRSVSDYLI